MCRVIAYNGDRVIEVNVTADPLQRVDLAHGGDRTVEFSYSVHWQPSDVPFAERMNRYAQYSFLPQSFEIHWLSIINSFVLVLLLTGFLSIILMRILKNDYVMDWEDNRQDEIKKLTSEGVLPAQWEMDKNEKEGKELSFQQRMDAMPLLMGQAAGAIDDVQPAKQIMSEMVNGAIEILRGVNTTVTKVSSLTATKARL